MSQWDLVVIGGGSAGLTAAMQAVEQGAKVAIVERSGRYGGTCRYVGCTPSKVLLHTAQALHTMRQHAAKLGLPTSDPQLDWERIKRHVDDVILRAGGDDGYDAPSDFYESGGKAFTGTAQFRSPSELAVGDEVLEASRFIIATGSRPSVPPIDGLEQAGYDTWETIFDLPAIPSTLLIIGGGPLAIEFSQMFIRFGSRVVVLEAEDQVLSQADPDAATALRKLLEAEGVEFRCGVEIQSVERDGDTRTVKLKGGDTVSGDVLLVAAGTRPNSDSLNLDDAGVQRNDKGLIEVDEYLQTSAEGIYACGDVATKYQFTHVAQYEGRIAVGNALGQERRKVDERVVPWAVYTDPSLAHVGMTEAQARDQGIDIIADQLPISKVERSLLVEKQGGLIKAVARRDNGELLGVDIVSPGADDLIHEAALAIRQRLSVRDVASTLHAYPTFSEGLEQLAQQLAAKIDDAD